MEPEMLSDIIKDAKVNGRIVELERIVKYIDPFYRLSNLNDTRTYNQYVLDIWDIYCGKNKSEGGDKYDL